MISKPSEVCPLLLVPSLAPGGFTNLFHFLNRKHSMHIGFVLKLKEYRSEGKGQENQVH